MATLAENAAAVKAAQIAIDAAIVAKGGTTAGGLVNAASAIEALPSGGGTQYPQPWKNDGNTHIWINTLKPNSRLILCAYKFVKNDGGDIVVDWGDGSTGRYPVSSASKQLTIDTEHTYSSAGDYEITISGYDAMTYVSSAFRRLDSGNYTYITPDYEDSLNSVIQVEFAKVNQASNGSYANRLPRLISARFDDDCTFETVGQWFLGECNALRSVRLPATCKYIGTNAFYDCYSLNELQASTIETIGGNAFLGCFLLDDLDLSSCTSIESGATDTMGIESAVFNVAAINGSNCRQCYYLKYVEIGAQCTSIGSYCVTVVPQLRTIVARATTPPTAGTGFMKQFPTTAKIFVPYSDDHSILAAYKAATNWSHRASQMFELNADGTIPSEA